MNILLLRELEKIENECDITEYQLAKVIESFNRDMTEKKMLKMLHTYIYDNLSVENGEYLAVDFGGTNIRITLYEVCDDEINKLKKSINIKKGRKFRLKDDNRDLTTNEYSLEDIFDFISEEIEKIVSKKRKYLLGHTFSFQLDSKSKNEAILTGLSKGFETKEAIGKDVNEVFKNSLTKRGLNVEPISIINDTTATFLTGKFYERNLDIAIIVGTGHNACFKDNNGEIINMESGYFSADLPLSYYDLKNIERNPKLKNNLLEILTGGKYIGKTANNIVNELKDQGLLEITQEINGKILTDSLNNNLDKSFSKEEKEVIEYIARILLKRSAKLVVAEIVAILNEIDSDLLKNHTIIFDGSVYEKNEYFRENIDNYLEKCYGQKAKKIKHIFIKDASNIGALLSIF